MRKILLSVVIIFCMNTVTWAQKVRKIVLWLQDGTQTQVQMDSHPQITFDDGDTITIKSSGLTVQYPSKDILKITHDITESSSIMDLSFRQEDEYFSFDSSVQKYDFHLYTVEGRFVPIDIIHDNGRIILPLSNIPEGVYLLKVNNKGIKILKK